MSRRTALALGLALALVSAGAPAWAQDAAPTAANPDAAALDPAAIEEAIAAFRRSPDAQLAPKTVKRAESFLGAALMARDNGDEAGFRQGLARARKALDDARATARAFRQRFGDLLTAMREAESLAAVFREDADPRDGAPDPTELKLLRGRFDEIVAAFESGAMGRAQTLAGEVRAKLQAWLKAAAEPYARLVERLLKRAARAGAKRYAVHAYAGAKRYAA